MGSFIFAVLDKFGPRLIASAVAASSVYVSAHTGLTVDPAAQTAVGLGVYGVIHTLLEHLLGKDTAALPPAQVPPAAAFKPVFGTPDTAATPQQPANPSTTKS